MTDLQTLIDERDIRTLLEGYARWADRNDEDAKVAMYHEEGWDDHGIFLGLGSEWSKGGRAKQMASVWRLFGNVQIELDGDVAYAEHYVLMVGQKPAVVDDPHYIQVLGGRFLDTLDRVDGVWKISYRRQVIDWQTVWDSDKPHYPPLEQFHRGSLGQSDRVYHKAANRQEWLDGRDTYGFVKGGLASG
ncbi:MAG: nuclear transport factor 2 family protein [Acidimicrobiia bacterium]